MQLNLDICRGEEFYLLYLMSNLLNLKSEMQASSQTAIKTQDSETASTDRANLLGPFLAPHNMA